MLTRITDTINRARERSRRRHAYRVLQTYSDHTLRDIGLRRENLYHALMNGRGAE